MEAIWREWGRPGAGLLLEELRRRGVKVKPEEVQAFVRSQTAAQVYAAPPKSDSHIVATAKNQRWYADLLDQTSHDTNMNDGYQYGLVVADMFTRRIWAWPLRHKVPEDTAGAMR